MQEFRGWHPLVRPAAVALSHNYAAQGPKPISPAGHHPDFGKQVAECKPGDMFGDRALGLMYGHPWAAIVLSVKH
jgi:cAMP-dependent protein kinase regulator